MTSTRQIRLGLIGDNIRRSQAPMLHRLAGELCGLDVRYDLLIPDELGMSFTETYASCRAGGYRGINVTYPYKETVVASVRVDDPRVAAIGACNTVLFDADGERGFNTDYSGFVSAFRACFPGSAPGIVAMAGAGGVGKAIGFGLADIGVGGLRLFDSDRAKAAALADALARAMPDTPVSIAATIEEAVTGADGLINCTPMGMVGYPGTAIPNALIGPQRWAFDAVYTPVETEFLSDARARGLEIMSGYELFIHQGIDAFRLFVGESVDPAELRKVLEQVVGLNKKQT